MSASRKTMAKVIRENAKSKDTTGSSGGNETEFTTPRTKSKGSKVRKAINLEPQQARSRESLRKLEKAAAEVLGQHGVEGTTIPRIAAHAGLTPGAVYRRFADKDALLESVILGIMERQDERLRTGLTPEAAAQIPLPIFAGQLINSLVISYRANAALLRAMKQFVRSRANDHFCKKVSKLESRTYEHLVDLLMASAKTIRHPEPKIALSFGLMMVISTLHELVVEVVDPKAWKGLLPQDDRALKAELTRSFLSYLGAP
jgi:AcrR family transcriptional regulator